MTYNILFIDEQKEAHRAFVTQFLKFNKERFTGSFVYPKETLDEMIDLIFNEEKPDAILTDYSLNDHRSADVNYDVQYSGADLVDKVQSRRAGFPIFITTSFGNAAVQQGADAKLIFNKRRFADKDASDNSDDKDLTFAERLFYEIRGYKKHLDDWSSEFDLLFDKKSKEKLNESEEARLIELDGLLESALDQSSKLPESFRETTNIKKLEELIERTQRILDHSK